MWRLKRCHYGFTFDQFVVGNGFHSRSAGSAWGGRVDAWHER